MAIKQGNTDVSAIYLGSTEIVKVYKGDAEIYSEFPVPVVDFDASTTGPTAGDAVVFTDLSTNTPTSWEWSFPGGTPTGSTGQNPTITYSATGYYDVTLLAGNTGGTGSLTKTDYIDVQPAPAVPIEETFTADTTWSCCPGATRVEVIAVGGGGGGGGGKPNFSLLFGAGGAGGGAGGVVICELTSGFGISECVIVGSGGAGGARSTSCIEGNAPAGALGGASCFGSIVIGNGGNGGAGGRITAGNSISTGGVGGDGSPNGGNASTFKTGPVSTAGGSATGKPGGGGAGGGFNIDGPSCTLSATSGGSASTICEITLGSGGSLGIGAGGCGGRTFNGSASTAGGAGGAGVVKVIQYFD